MVIQTPMDVLEQCAYGQHSLDFLGLKNNRTWNWEGNEKVMNEFQCLATC